jgi:replication factor C subunit 3/5
MRSRSPRVRQEMARSRPIDSKGRKGYKVLVLNEVDRLTKEAQHSLRRTMEKYSAACRLVLCCNNASRVRPAASLLRASPLHTRCIV